MKLSSCAVAACVVLGVGLTACGGDDQVASTDPGLSTGANVFQGKSTTTTTVVASGTSLADVVTTGEGQRPESGSVKMNATIYDDSVLQRFNCQSGAVWVYDLNRAYDRLKATVGLDDNSITGDKASLKFVGDNNTVLATSEATLGTTSPLDLDVKGLLRLRVEATFSGSCQSGTGYSSVVGLGNATLTKASS